MQKRDVKKMAIITRTKNRNLLLERALKSVLAQTSKDYVHVVLNDGGDKTAVEELLKKYPDRNRIVVHNRASVGFTPALNQAIRAVESQYISILDDDDSWAPERIATVINYMDKSQCEGAVVTMDRIIEEITPDGKVQEISRNRWHPELKAVSLYKQCLDNYLTNNCFNFTREAYERLNGFDESLRVAEDWDFGIRFLLNYDIDYIDTEEPLAYYHHRPSQTGDAGNSVFAGVNDHIKSLNYLRNKRLRDDLHSGKFGIGYIMNDLAYRQEKMSEQNEKDSENVVRLEGHINYVAEHSAEKIARELQKNNPIRKIKRIISKD